MGNDKTVHRHTNTTLRSRGKSKNNLAGAISNQTREVKQQGVPALERANNTVRTLGLENAVLPAAFPIEIKVLNFEKPINSER